MSVKDLAEMRFGRWRVTSFHYVKGRAARWLCICDCGTFRLVRSALLTNGSSKSCGCVSTEWLMANLPRRTHGQSKSSEFHTWRGLKQRCTNPKNPQWPDYGGRGINVCKRWLRSFAAFYSDMGQRPPGLTLDRRDNDSGYGPSNCRWATRSEQNKNRRPSGFGNQNRRTGKRRNS
jgi:hypothetical protein